MTFVFSSDSLLNFLMTEQVFYFKHLAFFRASAFVVKYFKNKISIKSFLQTGLNYF